MNNIDKYLTRYAEAEVAQLAQLTLPHPVAHCIVIPARDESSVFLQDFVDTFAALTTPLLLILVINQPDLEHTPSVDNMALLEQARQLFTRHHGNTENLELRQKDAVLLLLVDRFRQHPIPHKQGVGLARKIGGDLACKLYQRGDLCRAWVHSSDADAQLPNNYFSCSSAIDSATNSAIVYAFRHVADTQMTDTDRCAQATQLYENALRYLRQGLEYAGSPYAFYTLGSTLCFSVTHYCNARGFPKRAGGEDFYLLNKLAKLGSVVSLDNTEVLIKMRNSARVPFGTGPAVAKIQKLQNPESQYCYYDADIFELLRVWLGAGAKMWSAVTHGYPPFTPLPAEITAAAIALGAPKFLEHARRQCRSQTHFLRQFHQWFDAFQTIKFIHFMQNNGYPEQPLHTQIRRLEAWSNDRV